MSEERIEVVETGWEFIPDGEWHRLRRLEKAVAYQGVLLEKLRNHVDSVHQILPKPTEYGWKSQQEYEEALQAMARDEDGTAR